MGAHVFVDETRRGARYYLVAALVEPADLASLRKSLRRLLLPGQRELHFHKEKDARRRRLADRIIELDVKVQIFSAHYRGGDEEPVRRLCLEGLIAELLDSGADRLVLDRRDGRDDNDRNVLQARLNKEPDLNLHYAHLPASAEP